MTNLQPVAVKPPDYKKLLTLLNQSQIQRDNPALYNILEQLLQANLNGQTIINNNITNVAASIPGPGASPDTISIIQQPATWPGSNKGLLKVPIRRGAWYFYAGNAALTSLVLSNIGLSGLSTSFNVPIQQKGFTWGRDTGAAGPVVHNVANAGQTFGLNALSGGQTVTMYYRFNFPASSSLVDTRLRMGLYAGTLSTNGIPQAQAGAGVRYTFDDGTSPTGWIVETFDGAATRNTSAKFGNVTLAHEYVMKLVMTSTTIQAEQVDVTGNSVATSSVVSIPAGLITQGCEIGQIAWINTGATTTRTLDLASFEFWTEQEL